jgi:hypothetical protein
MYKPFLDDCTRCAQFAQDPESPRIRGVNLAVLDQGSNLSSPVIPIMPPIDIKAEALVSTFMI